MEKQLQAQIEALARGPRTCAVRDGRAVDRGHRCARRGPSCASPSRASGEWVTNAWVKQAILLYFRRRDVEWIGERGHGLAFYDKLPFKTNYRNASACAAFRRVSRATAASSARGVILMPGFVNIGAYVDEGTMIDTWATVGSCAQIGKDVHLSGGVGIGGVLEPPQATPVIVEDGAFIGSRCIVVEGVRVGTRSRNRRRRRAHREHADRRRAREATRRPRKDASRRARSSFREPCPSVFRRVSSVRRARSSSAREASRPIERPRSTRPARPRRRRLAMPLSFRAKRGNAIQAAEASPQWRDIRDERISR